MEPDKKRGGATNSSGVGNVTGSDDKAEVNLPNASSQAPRKTIAQIFASLMRGGLSHGAFHLWHCLYDYSNPKRGYTCFPGVESIAKDIGCRPESLQAWRDELIRCGWLSCSTRKGNRPIADGQRCRGASILYKLLDGTGAELIRKTVVVSSTENRSSSKFYGKPSRFTTEKRSSSLRKTVYEVTPSVREGERKERAKAAAPAVDSPAPLGEQGQQKGGAAHHSEINKPW
jgi:hypothetical protein